MSSRATRVAVITGSRAEFGLLRSTMRSIRARRAELELQVIIAGAHLLPETGTAREVRAEFEVASEVPMQRPGELGRDADAAALGRGISGFADTFARLQPRIALVLGDRIEAFAAAAAAAIGGRILAHVHGGDRAEGVADEAMRHAISKLAQIHFAATEASAKRLFDMGEAESSIHVVGSPAIDGLDEISPASDAALEAYGLQPDQPFAIALHHPCGLDDAIEERWGSAMFAALDSPESGIGQSLVLAPNHDPGREAVLRAIGARRITPHMPRSEFVALLRRAALLIGNSSAGLIEAAALRVPAVNVGPRQGGRERAGNVIDVDAPSADAISSAIDRALALTPAQLDHHPYGSGDVGERIASILAAISQKEPSTRKRNRY